MLSLQAERQITRQGTQRRPGHLDDSQDRAMDSMYWFKQLRKRERAKWMMIRDGFRPECNVVEVREGMATARAEKAMYLAQYMTNTGENVHAKFGILIIVTFCAILRQKSQPHISLTH